MAVARYVAVVRNRATGEVRYRAAKEYPHTGPGIIWAASERDAYPFETHAAAEKSISLVSNAAFEKFVGTRAQARRWLSTRAQARRWLSTVEEQGEWIAAVRLKSTGDVFYRIKGQISMWTSDRSRASHFPTRDEAERSISQVSSEKYNKYVGTAREVGDLLGERPIRVVAQSKENPRKFWFKTGAGWTDDLAKAKHFASYEEADRASEMLKLDKYIKFIGTAREVEDWVKLRETAARGPFDLTPLLDQVDENVRKLAEWYERPSDPAEKGGTVTFKVGGKLPERDFDFSKKPAGDPILALVETYIEKAQKIEEEGADEFTWRGFLHAFLKDVLEAGK